MQLSLLTESQVRKLFDEAFGDNLTASDLAADLLRHEVTARRRSPWHFLVGRVCRLAAPAIALDPKLVGEVCEDLERQGDIVLAEGGIVYPAPARIVALGNGNFRFVCAVPSARLLSTIEGEWTRGGVRRHCLLSGSAERAAEILGGIVVTPETWAGLDRTPPADADWLRGLEARLAWAPEPARSLERDEALDWNGFVVDEIESRWRASGPAHLWRARHRWKGWIYAWSAGKSPREQSFVTLYPDEGARTLYAIARAAEKPFRCSITKGGGEVTIVILGWLPQAEYRYLSTCAERLESSGRGSSWTMPAAHAEGVVNTLMVRLGVRVEQGQAT